MEVRHGRRLAVSLELAVDDRSRYDVIEVAGDEKLGDPYRGSGNQRWLRCRRRGWLSQPGTWAGLDRALCIFRTIRRIRFRIGYLQSRSGIAPKSARWRLLGCLRRESVRASCLVAWAERPHEGLLQPRRSSPVDRQVTHPPHLRTGLVERARRHRPRTRGVSRPERSTVVFSVATRR